MLLLAQLAELNSYKLVKMLSVCPCVSVPDVNQGGTLCNRCTGRLVILHTQITNEPNCTPKIGQSDLLYGMKPPAEKSLGVNRHCQVS